MKKKHWTHNLDKIYREIWSLSLAYQDKRDDAGHGETVSRYAIELCLKEKMKFDIVLPAAMLHDIGWSKLTREERFLIFSPDRTKEQERRMRRKHQDEGVKLARMILKKVKYPKKKTEAILEIISEHDTREGFMSKEEGLMRDADKLWRFSKTGIRADLDRFKVPYAQLHEKISRKIDEKDFFFSEAAKKIARSELKKRLKEFG